MWIKKFYQLSFILLLAIALTACTGGKKKTPGTGADGEDTDNIAKNVDEILKNQMQDICDNNPQSFLCKTMKDNKLLTLSEVKPIQGRIYGGKELLYWSDPLYAKGFQYTNTEKYLADCSIDTGSVWKVGDSYTFNSFDNKGELLRRSFSTISNKVLGGSSTQSLEKTKVGDKIVRMLQVGDTYVILPPIEIVA